MDKNLDQLLELDIREEVPDGLSGWNSPLVVVPKGDGDIRVCVHMRRLDKAIIHERRPIPTLTGGAFTQFEREYRVQQD